MSNNLAPIVVFAYKRLESLQDTIISLQKNILACESELYIYSDGAKNEEDKPAVESVRNYLKIVKGFKTVTIIQSETNKGLAISIISGVSAMFKTFSKIIVIEDDLKASENFLIYMNQTLTFYEKNEKVVSVGGFTTPMNIKSDYDVYFTRRSTSWGWGTWKDRWSRVDWNVSDYKDFTRSASMKKDFNRMGSDMVNMLERQMNGTIDSWAIRWCYHQFKYQLFSVHPFHSKIKNIGLSSKDATNTYQKYSQFNTKISDTLKQHFTLPQEARLNATAIKSFLRPYSRVQRIKFWLLNLLFK